MRLCWKINSIVWSLFPVWLFFINKRSTKGAHAIQCFCTSKEQPCHAPVCEGSLCLVGFKNDVDLVQTCATEAAHLLDHCAKKLNEWKEVCSCNKDLCNTFSLLRERTGEYDLEPARYRQRAEKTDTSHIVDRGAASGGTRKATALVVAAKKQQMIVLLVVIPLGVGGLAVVLIFLNYHCKMC